MIKNSVKKQLRRIVSRENYLDSDEELLVYGYDATPLVEGKPDAIVMPRSTEEVAEILRLANEEKLAIIPRGSGSGLSGGSVPQEGGLVMTWGRMNRILEIDSTNLVAIAEPGVITADLHTAVEKRGLYYPPDPGSMCVSTLGGNVGENSGGPHCFKYGVTKDYTLGLTTVLPSAEVLQLGGKVVKDVAGYDLCKLLVGSEGTLAVVTRIWVRLIPRPETKRTLVLHFHDLTQAADTVGSILEEKVIPSALEILDNMTIRCVEEYANIGLPTDVEAILLIEVDGSEESVRTEAAALERVGRRSGAHELRMAQSQEEADQLFEARRAALAALSRVRPTTMLEDVTVPRSQVGRLVKAIQGIAAKNNVQIGTFGHLGDGNLHPTILTDERDAEEMKRVITTRDEIFAAAVQLGGTISGEHGIGLAKRQFLGRQLPPPLLNAMRKIKSVFDPNNILNPHKIFEPSVVR